MKRILAIVMLFTTIIAGGWGLGTQSLEAPVEVEVEDQVEVTKQATRKTTVEPKEILLNMQVEKEDVKEEPRKETKKNERKKEVKQEEKPKQEEEKDNKKEEKVEQKNEVKKEPIKKEEKKEEEPKKPTKPKFTTETMSGDFMSEVSLNMRKGPGTEFEQVGTLSPYVKAVASEKSAYNGSTWYKITVDGVTGWSSSNYLKTYKENAKPKQETKATNSGSGYKANHFYFNGKAVPYKNGGRESGQAIIDGGTYASTWGGAPTFSGTDGKSTHFIGHSPGNFVGVQDAGSYIVTDANGTPFTYKVTKKYKVNSKGVDADGVSHWETIAGSGGGEKIVVQTCEIGTDWNWITEAVLVE